LVFTDTTGRPRVDIAKHTDVVTGDTTDMTFDKLDDSQWLLRWPVLSTGTSVDPPIIPKSTYSVYTDFIDSMPNAVFYARQTPEIILGYRNMMNTDLDAIYVNPVNDSTVTDSATFVKLFDGSGTAIGDYHTIGSYKVTNSRGSISRA